MPIISLLTDYGTRDAYVGAIKGVILGIAPEATIVDVTHEIEPYNVAHAAFLLRQVWPWYPVGTVHLVVVDPGVGTERRIIVGKYAGQYVVAPDNGLVTWLHRDFACDAMHVAEDRRYFLPKLSATFHGRDIMAPVAAHLASGVKLRNFGRVADRLEMLPIAHRAERTERGWRGRAIYVDRFGNLVTNVQQEQLAPPRSAEAWEVSVDDVNVGSIRMTFSDTAVGSPVAYFGGAGLLEIAINQGRAVERFGATPIVEVSLTPNTSEHTSALSPIR
ncbi:MAG: SAM-dependent chlorinase/fluorinase [Planctomycetota bacterium]